MLPNVDTRDHNFIVIALEFVLTMEILMTNKNNEMLVYDAYAYFKHRILTDTSISWRCVLSKCNGRVRTFQDNVTIINDHSHFPDPADIEKRKFRTALKTRAVVSDEPPRQTILSVQRDINRETAAVIPSYSANQRTINRVKQEKRPRMQEPQSLTDFELPELLKVTHSGERFLHFDSGPNDTKNVKIQYCYFHLSQSVWRHIQATGNTNTNRIPFSQRLE